MNAQEWVDEFHRRQAHSGGWVDRDIIWLTQAERYEIAKLHIFVDKLPPPPQRNDHFMGARICVLDLPPDPDTWFADALVSHDVT